MRRHFTARSGAAKLARTVLGQPGKRVFGIVLALMLTLFSSPVLASASCDAVNDTWNGVTVVAGAPERLDIYDAFADGDVVTYAVTTQNGTPADLDGSGDNANFTIISDSDPANPIAEVRPMGGLEANVSNTTPPLRAGEIYYFDAVGSGHANGDVTVTLSCAGAPAAPVAAAASASVSYDTAKSIDLSGAIAGVHSSIAVASGPAHGTVTVAGEVVSYTPTSGYFGADSFTYTATGPGGTSAPATVTLSVAAPGVPVAAAASASVPHDTPHAIDLAGSITGVHTSIVIDAAPGHGTTGVAGEVVTYTPVSGYWGADSFTYMAIGPGGTSAPATVTLTIADASAVFTPGSLGDAMAGEHYSATISVTGGTAYQVSAGALPTGLSLGSGGNLEGTLAAGSQGAYSFTVTATVGGAPAMAIYGLVVLPSAVTAIDKVVTIPPGATPLPVDLTAGATGGPFTGAIVGTVTPPQAGTAEITMGDVASIDSVWSHKFYLKFHPNPAYSGTVLVGYTLIGATGSSSATVQFIASLDANGVANNFDHLLKDFVRARASLLADGIDTPGLRRRREMGAGTSPGVINISPSDSSITMNFASSLAQLRAWGEAGDAAGALTQGDPDAAMAFNFWIDGTATLHLRDDDDGDEHWGRFALVSMGGDYLVNDKLLVGLALHADFMDDIADTTTIKGTGVLVGPYVSAEIVDGVFLDASVYYGHSWNEVDTSIFDGSLETQRLLAKASLEGQWALTEALTLRPKASAFYLHETAGQYSVTDGLGSAITIAGFTTDQVRLSAGSTLEYRMALGEGLSVAPYLGAQLGVSLARQNPAVLFTTLSTGFDLTGLGTWSLGGAIEADLESDSLKAVSAKAKLRAGF